MKRILFFVIMIGISLSGYAQEEFNAKYKPIPPKETKKKKEIPPKEISPKVTPPDIVKKPDSSLVDPKKLFNDINYYKKEANTEGVYYRKNQYLGSIKTKSLTSKIRYRDAAFLDGDYIRVFLNNKVIVPEVVLEGDYKEFEIKLEKGVNRIDIEALNEGFAPPNTAQFEVYDDKGVSVMSDQWNVGKGYKASIIIVRE
ncbi:hypothetical protein C8C85_0082 [Flavobacterium sp. 103]|uniref:hypothetical protein n=1 Tax=unclassified Flavobacterium TaxID=196869 RepID=UPI000D5EB600|nr:MULTISPECIES: hypothetical protein [unclassified Flavobacterium]PVX44356.1 hypothetical protein C8C85_0082 [Flavobacterium sp. 103]QKJ63529.1 hypothetical protein HQN62_10450 [Flavobacterium sp. M31R6]